MGLVGAGCTTEGAPLFRRLPLEVKGTRLKKVAAFAVPTFSAECGNRTWRGSRGRAGAACRRSAACAWPWARARAWPRDSSLVRRGAACSGGMSHTARETRRRKIGLRSLSQTRRRTTRQSDADYGPRGQNKLRLSFLLPCNVIETSHRIAHRHTRAVTIIVDVVEDVPYTLSPLCHSRAAFLCAP